MGTTRELLGRMLEERLAPEGLERLQTLVREAAAGPDSERFCALLSLAARGVDRRPLEPSAAERGEAAEILAGFDPERWTLLEACRVFLLLSHPGLAGAAGATAVEDAFRYADEGEACALYRSLAHLPGPERFLGRAREGCRSNMRSVFEASACDTPYLERHFDDVAWRQALVKCVFIGAPLARIPGVERRRDEELARMALDLADERRSAGRPVPPELWLLVGPHGGARALESLRQELGSPHAAGREAAARALERRGPPTSGS